MYECHCVVPGYQHTIRHSVIRCRPIRAFGCGALPVGKDGALDAQHGEDGVRGVGEVCELKDTRVRIERALPIQSTCLSFSTVDNFVKPGGAFNFKLQGQLAPAPPTAATRPWTPPKVEDRARTLSPPGCRGASSSLKPALESGVFTERFHALNRGALSTTQHATACTALPGGPITGFSTRVKARASCRAFFNSSAPLRSLSSRVEQTHVDV